MSSSRPAKSSVNKSMRRTRRRSNSEGRFCRTQKSSTAVVNGGTGGAISSSSSSVSEKLEALRNLLPVAAQIDGEIKADQLFQETADYIVLLRTRVLILQRLVDLYGSTHEKNKSEC